MELVDRLVAGLAEGPRTARELAASCGTNRSVVNSILYGHHELFAKTGSTPPVWSLSGQRSLDVAPVPQAIAARQASDTLRTLGATTYDESQLYAWQREALRAWRDGGRRGIVEAVTGAGKTRLGIAAVDESLRRREKVAVIVPTIELVRQWRGHLASTFPLARIGQLGDGRGDSLSSCDVLIATAHSGSSYQLGLADHPGLLIGDECHRYGSPKFQLALEEAFDSRLGLSATYRRSDGGHETVLEPYFGPVRYELGYERAITDGVVSRFRVALVAVEFTPSERESYDELSEQMSKARSTLVNYFGVPAEPFDEFFAAVVLLQKEGSRQESIAAGKYIASFNRRRGLLAETPAKLDVLKALAPAVADADRSLLFTQTTAAADAAAQRLRELGINARAIHSKLEKDERATLMRLFSDGGLQAVVAPKVLDEGVDVPAADLAVILAASQQRRQMVQRMGRVLRRKDDGRHARFAITFVVGTSEDPARGAHGAFLDEVLDVADEVREFSPRTSASELQAYLRPDPLSDRSVGATQPAPGIPESADGSRAVENGNRVDYQSQKLPKVVRNRLIAEELGISVETLITYRRDLAAAVAGTRGMEPNARRQLVAAKIGVPLSFVRCWEAAERQLT